ncbi:hypothetical protein APT68_16865 [Klebsiella pneumoniae]|nr:hypothetical protein APT70_16710 [Klebsiella pneumoniae]KSW51517.1 hypothetical protein APT68_16865 [Klebsiella pneumoniae]
MRFETKINFMRLASVTFIFSCNQFFVCILIKAGHNNRTKTHTLIRGLTLSGTKTHVKQRFLPLTPLLMVSDDLWSPVLPA